MMAYPCAGRSCKTGDNRRGRSVFLSFVIRNILSRPVDRDPGCEAKQKVLPQNFVKKLIARTPICVWMQKEGYLHT